MAGILLLLCHSLLCICALKKNKKPTAVHVCRINSAAKAVQVLSGGVERGGVVGGQIFAMALHF